MYTLNIEKNVGALIFGEDFFINIKSVDSNY